MEVTTSAKLTSLFMYINYISLTYANVSSDDSEVISNKLSKLCLIVNNVILGMLIGVLGIIGNIVNIIIFSRNGCNNSVNVSLIALSVADIGALITLQWFNICVNPWFGKSGIPFEPNEIQTLTGGFPHFYFTRVAGWITSFIITDRCVGILAPLRVKMIITAKLALIFNVGIFFIMIPTVIPVYWTTYFDWKFYSDRNETLLGVKYSKDAVDIQGVTFTVINITMATAFAIVIVCTGIITVELRNRSKWRNTVYSQSRCHRKPNIVMMSLKDARLIKLTVAISIVYLICSLPIVCFTSARTLQPELNIIGRYANLNWFLVSFIFLLETIYSSINIIIYHRMSSVYRAGFRQLFSKCQPKHSGCIPKTTSMEITSVIVKSVCSERN